MFETPAPGVFVVRYGWSDDTEEFREPLIEQIRAAARSGRVGIVFEVGPRAHRMDASIPTFWLRATSDPSLRLRAMAIVTESSAVGTAAAGFAAACAIRGSGLEAKAFRSAAPALAWVRARVAASRAAA